MKYAIPILVFSFLFTACSDKQNIEHLIFKNELAFMPESDKPYSGKVFKLQENGTLQFEGSYKNGKRDGEFKYYDKDGKKTTGIENYKEGKIHGKSITYFEDGNISSSGHFNMGAKNGLFTIYYQNGSKEFEGEYENDNPKNIHRYWYPDGKQIDAEFNYINGTIEIASAKLFYSNGKIKTEFKRFEKNKYQMNEFYSTGKLSHKLNFLYESYEERENCSFFDFVNNVFENGERAPRFDLGNSFNKFFDDEIYYSEDGKITKRTIYFFPQFGTIQKTYWSGTFSYNDVTSYTETYNSAGTVITKCADRYGCVSGEELKNMNLIKTSEDGD